MVTRNAESKRYNILHFDIFGESKVVGVFDKFEEPIYEHIQ